MMNTNVDSKKTVVTAGVMNGDQIPPRSLSSKEPCCVSVASQGAADERGWPDLVPSCGGCLSPRMTIRLLGSLVLVSGLVVSSAEGNLAVREEQHYQRCLLHQKGLVGNRHDPVAQPPDRGDAQDLSTCYPHNINLVRACTGLGVILLLVLILCTMLMFVAVATERWNMSLPWAYGCGTVILQEIVLIGGCWTLLGIGDFVLYGIHIMLLAYSETVLASILTMLTAGRVAEDISKSVYNNGVAAVSKQRTNTNIR